MSEELGVCCLDDEDFNKIFTVEHIKKVKSKHYILIQKNMEQKEYLQIIFNLKWLLIE